MFIYVCSFVRMFIAVCYWFFEKFKSILQIKRNVPKPIAKSVLIPLGLTAATSTADTAIH